MRYAHAGTGERCAKCNDLATRIVGTQPLCIDHFASLIDPIIKSVRKRMLTPTDLTPEGFKAWAIRLEHGINIGAITPDEAANAWETAREFAT